MPKPTEKGNTALSYTCSFGTQCAFCHFLQLLLVMRHYL